MLLRDKTLNRYNTNKVFINTQQFNQKLKIEQKKSKMTLNMTQLSSFSSRTGMRNSLSIKNVNLLKTPQNPIKMNYYNDQSNQRASMNNPNNRLSSLLQQKRFNTQNYPENQDLTNFVQAHAIEFE